MKNKYLEYYMDSKIYGKDEVQKSIEDTKKEFPNKEIEVQVRLNEFGVYIIKFTFKNKNSFIKNIFIKLKIKKKNKLLLAENEEKNVIFEKEKKNKENKRTRKNKETKKDKTFKNINQIINVEEKEIKTKQDKVQKRFEKYYGRTYGAYKPTHTYKPY